jgi:hypothetical protein
LKNFFFARKLVFLENQTLHQSMGRKDPDIRNQHSRLPIANYVSARKRF